MHENIPWAASGDRFWEWLSENRTRAIVLAVLVVVPVLAWQYSVMSRARDQVDGYKKIQAMGGIIGWDRDNQWYGANFSGQEIGDGDLAVVASFEEFTSLNFSHTQITNAGLSHFRDRKGLLALSLRGTKVTDEGLRNLGELPQLHRLNLAETPVTDSGLEHLRAWRQLQFLSLAQTQVTDAGLEHLRQMKTLRVVHLSGSKVTPEGLAALKRDRPGLRINPKRHTEDNDWDEVEAEP
jgi:hypothetical protein